MSGEGAMRHALYWLAGICVAAGVVLTFCGVWLQLGLGWAVVLCSVALPLTYLGLPFYALAVNGSPLLLLINLVVPGAALWLADRCGK
jgi:hypothetical protein